MPTILVVEDRAADRRFLATLLSAEGYQIVESSDGEEALRLLAAQPVHLVISDILMPTVDGYEFVRRLRAVPGLAGIPVVFYTATYHEREARALARQCGVVEILTKPSDAKTILATVESALGGATPSDAPPDREAFDREHVQLLSRKLLSSVQVNEQRMAAIVDVARQITAEHDPLILLRRVCDEARSVTFAQYAILGLLDDDGVTVRTVITSGLPNDVGKTVNIKSIRGTRIAEVIGERRPMRMRDPRPAPGLQLPDGLLLTSSLDVPIASATYGYGWISLGNKLGADEFSQDDEEIASALATHAAVAYENARLYDDLRLHAVALEQEVSERARVEEQLRNNEERTQLALAAARMGVWDWDLLADRVTGSDVTFRLAPQDAPRTSREFFDRIHPSDRQNVWDAAQRAIRDGNILSVEFRIVGPDDHIHWVDARARVVADGNGQPVRVIGISADISERKSLEAQFRQAQKMEAIGQLAGGVAHDFNNLLTAILGYANLLGDSLESADVRRLDVDEITRAAQRAAGLTKQLLAFSRRQVLRPTLVNVNSLVGETTRMLGRLIGENIELVTALAAQPALVNADPTQLEQIVMNLAVNARDAMPGGGRLSIETADVDLDDVYLQRHPVVRPGQYVMLAVSDTGTGMDEDTKRRLFEPFFTTKEQGKGTGLGLATVYGIVKQSAGYIWVYSEPRLGSTFKVYLPRVLNEGSVDVAESEVQRPAGGSETVLVVEDEEGVRLLTRMLLERAGYRVLAASSPHEAEAAFETRGDSIDLLVSDVVMPGSSGPILYERLSERWPALKVVFMSGYTGETMLRDHHLDANAAFLQKPFTTDGLLRKVREVLDQ